MRKLHLKSRFLRFAHVYKYTRFYILVNEGDFYRSYRGIIGCVFRMRTQKTSCEHTLRLSLWLNYVCSRIPIGLERAQGYRQRLGIGFLPPMCSDAL